MHRHAFLIAVAVTPALPAPGHAQDGRIVEARPFTADDSLVARLRLASGAGKAAVERVEMREITYLSDGLRVKGFVLTPRGGTRLPVIVFNRGGCKNFGALTKPAVAEWLAPFADWGYVVVASQYRGNGGSEGKDEFGGRDVNDILNLLRAVDSLPRADATRIGIWSESRGGLMTYLVLARTDRIRAAVISSAPTDLSTIAPYRKAIRPADDFEEFCLRDAIPSYDRDKARELVARSAIRWAEQLSKTTPILLFQGTADWRSDPQQTLDMAQALLKLRRPYRLVVFEGGSHELSEHWEEVLRISKAWLDRYVRDRQPWPSLEPHGW